MTLLFFDSAPEILFILVIALIIFGPRKLPELSRSLGKSLGEFKRASDEFKRTWEREVNLEAYERERKIGEAMLPEEITATGPGNMLASSTVAPDQLMGANTIARGAEESAVTTAPAAGAVTAATVAHSDESNTKDAEHVPQQSPNKADWL